MARRSGRALVVHDDGLPGRDPGIALLATGHRRRSLEAAATGMFLEDLSGRILPFDPVATGPYARIFAKRRRAGRAIGMVDAMIAAIAHVHGAALVTRNICDFESLELRLIDPWRPDERSG